MRKKSLIIVILLLMFVGLGYAILTTNLNINGSAEINNPTWDVHFDGGGSSSDVVITGTTSATFDTSFSYPGQVQSFYIKVVNGGTIDAMLKSYNLSYDTTYYNVYVSWECYAPLSNNDLLENGTNNIIKIDVSLKKDIDELPTKDCNITLSLDFVQNDGGQYIAPRCAPA